MTHESEELTAAGDQAAHWSVVFRDSEATATEKREFVEWVTQAPENVEASIRVARMRTAVSPSNVRWPDTPIEELVREARSAPGENVVPLHPGKATQPKVRRNWGPPIALGLAASLLVALGLAWFTQVRPEQFQTKVGEQRSVLLADGSRITLNTASKIEVRLRKDQRDIELIQGEALFEAAHDAQRPFDVHVGNVVVRAVGTEFNIDLRATRTVVTVVEGRVAVSAAGAGAMQLPLLSEADRVVIDSAGPTELQHGVNLSEATAWTQRQLVFQSRPLGEIAEEFNRYSSRKIEIRSPSLRYQAVTGTFRSDDLASFVTLLADIPGVHVTDSETGGYVVTFDDSPAPRR
jgi:transmembrane sensor